MIGIRSSASSYSPSLLLLNRSGPTVRKTFLEMLDDEKRRIKSIGSKRRSESVKRSPRGSDNSTQEPARTMSRIHSQHRESPLSRQHNRSTEVQPVLGSFFSFRRIRPVSNWENYPPRPPSNRQDERSQQRNVEGAARDGGLQESCLNQCKSKKRSFGRWRKVGPARPIPDPMAKRFFTEESIEKHLSSSKYGCGPW